MDETEECQKRLESWKIIHPENESEKRMTFDSDWLRGVFSGKPRSGHPEGLVIYHIRDVLANVEKNNNNVQTQVIKRLLLNRFDRKI